MGVARLSIRERDVNSSGKLTHVGLTRVIRSMAKSPDATRVSPRRPSVADLRARHYELQVRGAGILSQIDELLTAGFVYWDLKKSLLRDHSEELEILEEKAPMVIVFRELYNNWNDWKSDCVSFLLDTEGSGSATYRAFWKSVASTVRLFSKPGSRLNEIRTVIAVQVLSMASVNAEVRNEPKGRLSGFVETIDRNSNKLLAIIGTILGVLLAILVIFTLR